ncbi:MAG: hypothetical protein ACJ8EJ_02875 [Xanthobacteraceae bacterium]
MKRSAQVALVLIGATAVGASSYALAPRTDCVPPGSTAARPPAVAPGTQAQPGEPCRATRRSSSSGYSRWGSSGGSTWGRSSSTHTTTSTALHSPGASVPAAGRGGTSTAVARGGFGSTGHAVSSGG